MLSRNLNNEIIAVTSAVMLGVLLNFIDCISTGRNLFQIPHVGDKISIFANLPMSIYIYSTICAQFIGTVFTGIRQGTMYGCILENTGPLNTLAKSIYKSGRDIDSCNMAFVGSIFLGTIAFAVLSVVLGWLGIGHALKYIPTSATAGTLAVIGILLLETIKKDIGYKDIYNSTSILSLLITVVLIFLAFFLCRRYPDATFMLHAISGAVTLLFYLIFKVCLSKDHAYLTSNSWLSEIEDRILSPREIINALKIDKFDGSLICEQWRNILFLCFSSIIHIGINLTIYSMYTGTKIDYNRELVTQGIMNVFSAFTISPSYFVCSYSIEFHRAGAKTKKSGVILAIMMIPLIYVVCWVMPYLPRILLGMFSGYICLSIVFDSLKICICRRTLIDCLVVLVTCIIGRIMENPGIAMISGIVANVLIFSVFSFWPSSKLDVEPIHGSIVQRGPLCFYNVSAFMKKLFPHTESARSYLVIDFRRCVAVDWFSSDLINERLRKIMDSNCKVSMWGVPHGLDVYDLIKQKNFRLLR